MIYANKRNQNNALPKKKLKQDLHQLKLKILKLKKRLMSFFTTFQDDQDLQLSHLSIAFQVRNILCKFVYILLKNCLLLL